MYPKKLQDEDEDHNDNERESEMSRDIDDKNVNEEWPILSMNNLNEITLVYIIFAVILSMKMQVNLTQENVLIH